MFEKINFQYPTASYNPPKNSSSTQDELTEQEKKKIKSEHSKDIQRAYDDLGEIIYILSEDQHSDIIEKLDEVRADLYNLLY